MKAQLAKMPPMVLLSVPCEKWKGKKARGNLLHVGKIVEVDTNDATRLVSSGLAEMA